MDIVYTNINKKSLMKVKVFNRIKEAKWAEDVKNWNSKNGGIPFLPMYIF